MRHRSTTRTTTLRTGASRPRRVSGRTASRFERISVAANAGVASFDLPAVEFQAYSHPRLLTLPFPSGERHATRTQRDRAFYRMLMMTELDATPPAEIG